MEEKKKKKAIFLASVLMLCAFVGLIGFIVYQDAVDKEYEAVEDTSSHKHIIKDVTLSAKTPNFVKGWNYLVDHVNSFTAKSKEEFQKLPDEIKEKKEAVTDKKSVSETPSEDVSSEKESSEETAATSEIKEETSNKTSEEQ